jgi:hypothetical protein
MVDNLFENPDYTKIINIQTLIKTNKTNKLGGYKKIKKYKIIKSKKNMIYKKRNTKRKLHN